MKVAVIGAGIAGLIAEGAMLKTFGNDIAVFDDKPKKGLSDGHKAVMRLRDRSIKEYVNCDLKKIKAQKAILHKGVLYDRPNLLLNNLYSLKAYGSLGNRSLSSLGDVDRYLISNIRANDINYIKEKVYIILKDKKLVLESESKYDYDICISTVPMPALLKMCGLKYHVKFDYRPIFVTRAKLNIRSNIHQTLYFTDSRSTIPYRMTIQDEDVIAESMFGATDMYNSIEQFGLNRNHIIDGTIDITKQDFGKIEPIDDNLRRRILMDLTDEFGIYSLGRFATWRSLRIDQVVEDVKKIIMLIKVKHKAYYIDH